MTIIDYDTFVKMPEGTLYREYSPCVFGELQVKGETINDGRDWFLKRLSESFYDEGNDNYTQFHEQCQQMENGEELKGDYETQERDGMFDYNRKFLVYNNQDIKDLVVFLNTLIK